MVQILFCTPEVTILLCAMSLQRTKKIISNISIIFFLCWYHARMYFFKQIIIYNHQYQYKI